MAGEEGVNATAVYVTGVLDSLDSRYQRSSIVS